jgi:hypothetical protein
MYEMSPGKRERIIKAELPFTVLAEIKTFLMMLKASNSHVLQKIQQFTREFAPKYAKFTIDSFIARVNELAVAANTGLITEEMILGYEFTIVMPPQAVAEYIRKMWGRDATVSKTRIATENSVVGVRATNGGDTRSNPKMMYEGLIHYVYYSRGTVHSWNQDLGTIESAKAANHWEVCYVISLT